MKHPSLLYVHPGTAVALALLLCLLTPPVLAVIETYEFSSPALEERYHRLSQELRCPKCQNQNIADSNAPISEDLRRLLYEQLEAGYSDEDILDDMVARYGEFVRYRPKASGVTLWLWLAPVILLLSGLGLLLVLLRRGVAPSEAELSEEERAHLATVLNRDSAKP